MKVEAYYPQRLLISLVILLCVLALGPAMGALMDCQAQAQESERRATNRPPAQPPDGPGVISAIADVREDYRINSGDVIDIQVDRAPELSGMRRVTASGTVRMEYLGPVTAHGKTADELAGFIADSLRGRYLKNPRVTVTIEQMNSHTFFIQGAVNRPGAYQIEGRPALLTLITVAGGLKENHGSTALIIREAHRPDGDVPDADEPKALSIFRPWSGAASPPSQSPPQSEDRDKAPEERESYELIKVNINELFSGDFDKNMRLDPRSVVHIPQAEVYFVGGDVNAPGSFPFKEGATLRQAITLAQGMKPTAASDRAIIYREDPGARKRQEIRIDAGKIMNGKQEDIAITANDIVIIPNSRSRSVGGALLSVLGIHRWRILGY
ncbi:MAG TPA: polysaccharide biosynthesis/export family protein [Blastocatellia bacterium]|nr:polysaccharide biosynthesis/export family protein [Blastocatellia bacterium]